MYAPGQISAVLMGGAVGIAVLMAFSAAIPAPIPVSLAADRGPGFGGSNEVGPSTSAPVRGDVGQWHYEPSISIAVGDLPEGIAYDNRNGDVYVANLESNNVSVINGTTNTVVRSISLSSGSNGSGAAPIAVASDAANGNVYVADVGFNELSVINGTTNTLVGTIPTGPGPEAVAYDSRNGNLYVANIAGDDVSVINASTGSSITSIPAGTYPDEAGYDPANGLVYISNYGSANVTVINGTTERTVASIPTGIQPGGIAFDNATGEVYATSEFPTVINYSAGQANYANVSVVNGSTNQVVTLIPVYANPFTAVFDPRNGDVFVANAQSNVTVIDATTNTVIGSIPVGDQPTSLAYDAQNGYIYCADVSSDNVTVIGAIPPLASVAVAPSTAMVPTDGVQRFTTTLGCARGFCPSGATYDWTLSNTRASLNSTGSPAVGVTAGPAPGSVTLFVNVTLNTVTIGASVRITIVPGLTSLEVAPASTNISPGTTRTFAVTPVCAAGTCPAGVTYLWTLTNYGLGNLNSSLGSSVAFTATATGSLRIYVNATLLNQTVVASAAITVASSTPTPIVRFGPVGLPEPDAIGLVVGIAAVAILAAWFALRKKRPGTPDSFHPPP